MSGFLGKWSGFGKASKRDSSSEAGPDPMLGVVLSDFGSSDQLYYLRVQECELKLSHLEKPHFQAGITKVLKLLKELFFGNERFVIKVIDELLNAAEALL